MDAEPWITHRPPTREDADSDGWVVSRAAEIIDLYRYDGARFAAKECRPAWRHTPKWFADRRTAQPDPQGDPRPGQPLNDRLSEIEQRLTALEAGRRQLATRISIVAGWVIQIQDGKQQGGDAPPEPEPEPEPGPAPAPTLLRSRASRTVELPGGVALHMVGIPAGSFEMGDPSMEFARPIHTVTLSGFLIGQTPITQAQWQAVMGTNPSRFQGFAESPQLPVERVSWEDAVEFCRRLSALSGDLYTLPSEAQWEYACRAGTTTPLAFGDTITPELANYDGSHSYANSPKGINRQQTTPVGMLPANAWGLHDMHGNVWEWCADFWHESYAGAPADGTTWLSGGRQNRRLLRGGSWNSPPRDCRSACRLSVHPGWGGSTLGFRVICLSQEKA
jgi:formylglycine-generating enzyme required for sulfatase activity